MPAGQPTDNVPIDETDQREQGTIMKLLDTLITKQWFWLKGTIVTDKGFTTFRGLQWLADRGIAGVGMCKTKGRPKKLPHTGLSVAPTKN